MESFNVAIIYTASGSSRPMVLLFSVFDAGAILEPL